MTWLSDPNTVTSVKDYKEIYMHTNLQWPYIKFVSYMDFCCSASLLHVLAL